MVLLLHAAAVRFDLHIPESRSLKVQRATVRPIVDGLRHRYHLSVAEIGYQDQWQRAELGVAVIAESDGHLREVIDEVERFVARAPDVEVLDVEVVHFDGEGTLDWESQLGVSGPERPGAEAAESGRVA